MNVSRNENFESTYPGDFVTIRKLPEVEYEGRDRQIASGDVPLWFSFDSSIATFHRVQPTAEPGYYETDQFTPRGDLEPSITSAFHWNGIDVAPTFTMHETFYGQSFGNGAVISSALNRSAPEINIDIVFPTIERTFNKKTFLGDKFRHVIEPRLNYKYVTGVDNFANTLRFDAIDLLADTSELEAGITNRIYAKTGNTVTGNFHVGSVSKTLFRSYVRRRRSRGATQRHDGQSGSHRIQLSQRSAELLSDRTDSAHRAA